MPFITVIAVAIGGACGALCRLGANTFASKTLGAEWLPVATFTVNMIGCLLLGLLTGLSSQSLSEPWRMGLATGFLGALTTFSTYAVEIATRSEEKQYLAACGIVSANLVFGIALAFAGLAIARSMFAS